MLRDRLAEGLAEVERAERAALDTAAGHRAPVVRRQEQEASRAGVPAVRATRADAPARRVTGAAGMAPAARTEAARTLVRVGTAASPRLGAADKAAMHGDALQRLVRGHRDGRE